MVVKIVGTQKVDFTSKDGDYISGDKYHFTYVSDLPSSVGLMTDTIFVRSDSNIKRPSIICGKDYEFVYTFNGRRPVLSEIKPVN